MYGCESWTIKKGECQRIDAFELLCCRKLLRVPWTARRSHQSVLKEISPEYSLEGLMLKLKLQYFGHLMGRSDSFKKTLMLGKIEGGRRRGWQRMRWTWVWVNSGSWCWTWRPGVLQSMGLKELDTIEQLNLTELGKVSCHSCRSTPFFSWITCSLSRNHTFYFSPILHPHLVCGRHGPCPQGFMLSTWRDIPNCPY